MQHQVGDRVQSQDGFRATVRYVGSVTGATPEDGWVGLEWDVEGRGKHDGTYKGARYFECADGFGSFVRPDSVLANPLSFQVRTDGSEFGEDAAGAEEKMDFRSAEKGKAAIVCEFVGKERELQRMQKTSKLEHVTLIGARIWSVGDPAWLKENASGVKVLILDDNLFSSWGTVLELLAHLPQLQVLSLNGNKMVPPDAAISKIIDTSSNFQSLTELALKTTRVDFDQLDRLMYAIPTLKNLRIANNNITQISSKDFERKFDKWPKLELLDLSDNKIDDWNEVLHLAKFRDLQHLLLNGNLLREVFFNRVENFVDFPELKTLAVANNQIGSMHSIFEIKKLANIVDLKFQGNPLAVEHGVVAMRSILIAVIPGLTSVNGSEVRSRDKLESEKCYIATCVKHAAGRSVEDIAASDPTFAALIQKHGAPVMQDAAARSNSSTMLSVTLKSMASDSCSKAPLTRKLPASMTVANLKRMCQQLFKLDVSKQSLYVKSKDEIDAWTGIPVACFVRWRLIFVLQLTAWMTT
eukprot:749263-Hanusia_phi.AAC.10